MVADATELEAGAKKRNLFDRFVLFVAIAEPIATLPQVYEVWVKHQTGGVSAYTWILYFLIECVWLAYGIKQKDRAVIAGSLLWGLTELAIVVGVLVK